MRGEGFPDKYDPDAVAATFDAVITGLDQDIEAVRREIPAFLPPGPALFPTYKNVRVISIYHQAGIYGDDADPRVAHVQMVDGQGVDPSLGVQRFRFQPGTHLVPLGFANLDERRWNFDDAAPNLDLGTIAVTHRMVPMGTFVVGIPHSLGRCPEWVLARSSSSRDGPAGQAVQITGGSLDTPWAPGTHVRADFDFIPILGTTPTDITRQLKFLTGFSNGAATTSEHSYEADPTIGAASGNNQFDVPELLDRYASEMVTTDRQFSGLLVATTAGFASLSAGTWGHDQTGPPVYFGTSQANQPVRDGVSNASDPNCSSFLPTLPGKALWGSMIDTTRSYANPQALWASGYQVSLIAGSVDFVMG